MRAGFPILALGGLALAALGWILAPGPFFGAWLAAVTWFAAWPLGSVGLLLVHALAGGRWGVILRPALRQGCRALVLLVPLALPLALGAGRLYPWVHGAAPAGKSFYLNGPFFAGRTLAYLVIWCGLGVLTLTADELRLKRLAPSGLILLALTVSFAAIDTGMSLDLGFSSSVYGLIALAGAGLLALSIAVLATAIDAPDPEDWPDLGRLLLGLVVLWAYLDFVQFLIVWESDLRREVAWYLTRSEGLWGAVAWALGLGHFLLPFAILLSGRAKRRPAVVIGVAGLLVVLEILRAWWLILPSLGRPPGWTDLAAMAGLAGLMGCGVVWRPLSAARVRP